MKIAHFITRLIIGGAQENTLLTVEDQKREFQDQVCLISGPGLGPEGSLEDRAKQNGVDLRILPSLRRNLHPWNDWKSYRELLKLLREDRPDLLHTHSSKAGLIGRAAAAKLKIPVVHTIHGASFHYGQSPFRYRLYRSLEKWAARRTDHFISVCDAMTEQYLKLHIVSPEHFTTIPSGMEIEPFLHPSRPVSELRTELGFTEDQIVIGKVARLFDLKGHPWLIESAKQIVQQHPHVRFLLVGDGIHKKRYQQTIQELGMKDHFHFTGLVPPSEVPDLIHAMDIVVHVSEWEGLARVLVQGLLAEKPVVSFDIDGAKEVIIPGETGFLVPPRDLNRLTNAMLTLCQNESLRNTMGKAGRSQNEKRYHHLESTRRIREIYQKVLQSK